MELLAGLERDWDRPGNWTRSRKCCHSQVLCQGAPQVSIWGSADGLGVIVCVQDPRAVLLWFRGQREEGSDFSSEHRTGQSDVHAAPSLPVQTGGQSVMRWMGK